MRAVRFRRGIFFALTFLALTRILSAEDFKPRGLPLFNIHFDFTIPFKLVPNTVYPGKGDWIPGALAFPFGLGFDVGYILQFAPDHSVQAMASLTYDDDPVNHLFDKNLSTKSIVPSFTLQSLFAVGNLKYSWRLAEFLKTGLVMDGGVQLYRISPVEAFDKGLNNSTFLGGVFQVNVFRLDRILPFLGNLEGELDLGFHYYGSPNYKDIVSIGEDILNKGLNQTNTDFKPSTNSYGNYRLAVSAQNLFFERLQIAARYDFTIDAYPQQPVLDLNGNDSKTNELALTHIFALQSRLGLFGGGKDHPPLELGLGLEGRLFDYNKLEQIFLDNSLLGDLPKKVLSYGAPIDSTRSVVPFPGYQSYNSFTVSPSVDLHFSKSAGMYFLYSLSSRGYTGRYATWGAGENAAKTPGSFKNELVSEIYHVVTFGFHFHSANGYRDVNPFVGWQRKLSNNKGDADVDYHLFLIGIKTQFEF